MNYVLRFKWALLSILLLLVAFIAYRRIVNDPLRGAQFGSVSRGELVVAVYGSALLKTSQVYDLKLGTLAKISGIRVSIGDSVKKGQALIDFDGLPDFRSPLNGVVTALNYRLGETAFAQSTILTVSDNRDLYLEMSLDQRSIRNLKVGQEARISLDGYRDKKYAGRLKSIFSNAGQFFAIINFKSEDASLLPGMSADVSIIIDQKVDVLKVPLAAVKDNRILLLEKSEIKILPVKVGANDGFYVELLEPALSLDTQTISWTSLSEKTQAKLQKQEAPSK